MASHALGTPVAGPAQFRAFHPVVSTVVYEVRNMTGDAVRYLCNAVPLASYLHKGDGWTRVTVPTRDEGLLLDHLKDFFEYAYRKL